MNSLFEFLKDRRIQFTKVLSLLVSRRRTTSTRYRRILFLRRDGIGDAVMFMPAFRAIKQKFPLAQIDLVNFKGPDTVLSAESEVNVIESVFLHFCRCFLKGHQYDCAVVFSGGRELPILKFFQRYRNITVVSNTLRDPGEHYTGFYFRLCEMAFGKLTRSKPAPYLTVTAPEKAAARNTLLQNDLVNHRKIGIIVGSIAWWKRYSNWQGLLDHIKADPELKDCKVCLLGGPTAKTQANTLCAKYQDIINFTHLSLRQAMALACELDLLLCVDSGFMHVANALGTKTLALFGPTEPLNLIGNNGHNRILAATLQPECSPCYDPHKNFSCKRDSKCMEFPADRLLTIAKQIIAGEKDFKEPVVVLN